MELLVGGLGMSNTLKQIFYNDPGITTLEVTFQYEHHQESFEVKFNTRDEREKILEMLKDNDVSASDCFDAILNAQWEQAKSQYSKSTEPKAQLPARIIQGPLCSITEDIKSFFKEHFPDFKNYETEFEALDDIKEELQKLTFDEWKDLFHEEVV